MEIKVFFHPHALLRMGERGTLEEEVAQTIREGEQFPVKFDRTGFRHNFSFEKLWQGKRYANKQVEAFAVKENCGWLVITVIVRYF